MKEIRVVVEGISFRVFEDGVEIKGIKQFLLKAGVEYAPTMEMEEYLIDECKK